MPAEMAAGNENSCNGVHELLWEYWRFFCRWLFPLSGLILFLSVQVFCLNIRWKSELCLFCSHWYYIPNQPAWQDIRIHSALHWWHLYKAEIIQRFEVKNKLEVCLSGMSDVLLEFQNENPAGTRFFHDDHPVTP